MAVGSQLWHLQLGPRDGREPLVKPTRKSIISPVASAWDLSISASDFGRLKVGFRPECMEDRWVIQVTDPDPDHDGGATLIHISRSWTYMELYTLHVKKGDDGSIKIESITWKGNQFDAVSGEERSKKEAMYLCRALLGCAMEAFPKDD
ncbi:hypothetical protein MAPG_06424 [Magnaporthiopsis poae ATCC 64411]|uniref:Uncharacterized protein n=1 Tax=Magnaporthiopsis poae (strain ATCC 64411 / 73-15) TaxID=644358 RepID=A0A0C4E1Z8_MAGP6|nr:hypothetical protein MAPG_06424 [Magnaporthiopsis poae ATCC 64411]